MHKPIEGLEQFSHVQSDESIPTGFYDASTHEIWTGSEWMDAHEFEAAVDELDRQTRSQNHSNVDKPSHYQTAFGVEAIDIIKKVLTHEEFKGYCEGNWLKYRIRSGKKGSSEEDIKKANEYEKIYERYIRENTP